MLNSLQQLLLSYVSYFHKAIASYLLWLPEALSLTVPVLLVGLLNSSLTPPTSRSIKWMLVPSFLYIKLFSYAYVGGYVSSGLFYSSSLFKGTVGIVFLYNLAVCSYIAYKFSVQPKSILQTYKPYFLWLFLYTFLLCYMVSTNSLFLGQPLKNDLYFIVNQGIIMGGIVLWGVGLYKDWKLDSVAIDQYPDVKISTELLENEPKYQLSIADSNTTISLKKELCPNLKTEYVKRIRHALESEEVFLNSKLSLALLAQKVDITPHQLSYTINNEWGLNFNELINLYRVKRAKQLLEDKNHISATIFAIAIDSGFNSESSFYTVFKKSTGYSPKRFREALKMTSKL
ncbi:helix-turn-helix domain-containing protein [Runella sp. MFBS21]|uniref:helix-turn-helix domain-containing protein n=1 Tax=Runella sp. MFBS21 TaxID=3034018 RepID=UPI0023F70E20|nr:helix-turn-helix domain-containing protein [Runella sp. MFBS21]MDF7818240.1 helix-turn-helix domain-containing protein [Runella sp. MFBS21]